MPDPFFEEIHDGQWNALVGRQGDELNYVDGYIQAALELATAILDKRLYGRRDTLILPILYNARHAVELALKFCINRLHQAGALAQPHPVNHDIKSHWKHVHDANVGDLAVRNLVAAFRPYVDSLASIDEDGQELRYAVARDGVISLSRHATVNIKHVREGLTRLSATITALVDRLIDMDEERLTKTFTRECSRRDLIAIAQIMGPRSSWRDDRFTVKKAEVCARYTLTNGKFSRAIDAIVGSRELGVLVGIEKELTHLSDDKAVAAISVWKVRNTTPRRHGASRGIVSITDAIERIESEQRAAADLNRQIIELLSIEELADLAALFDLGRLRRFGEHYEDTVAEATGRFRAMGHAEAVAYLMQKTNLQDAVTKGAAIAGRPGLSVKLAAIGAARG
jgi:hypothetical protein